METVHAVYEGKTFRLKHPLDLKPGQEVELIVKELEPVETDPLFDIASLAVETEVADLAVEHDHYLYGTPKRGKKDARIYQIASSVGYFSLYNLYISDRINRFHRMISYAYAQNHITWQPS